MSYKFRELGSVMVLDMDQTNAFPCSPRPQGGIYSKGGLTIRNVLSPALQQARRKTKVSSSSLYLSM